MAYKELEEKVQVGQTYLNDNGWSYECVVTSPRYSIFRRPDRTQFIVTWLPKLYDVDGRKLLSWCQGHYFTNYQDALARYEEKVCG